MIHCKNKFMCYNLLNLWNITKNGWYACCIKPFMSWNKLQGFGIWKINSFFKNLGFNKCEMEYGMYVHHTFDGNVIMACLYVDDILLTVNYTSEINKFKKMSIKTFDMSDLKNMIYFLGMKILHSEKGIIVHQSK